MVVFIRDYICRRVLQLVLCYILFSRNAICDDNDEENLAVVKAHAGFFSLADTLSAFADKKFQDEISVQGLLRIYRTRCPMYFGKCDDHRVTHRHVFVVVEGTHRITRNIVSNKLAEVLKGKHLYSPPGFMTKTRLVHNETSEMKRAFFMLGIYGTAHNVRDTLSEMPVVTAGYYVDQIAFSIAGAFESGLPNKTSVLYKWPSDLLKPDIMFFINTPSQLKKRTIVPDSFRGRIVQIYRNWAQPPPVVEVNSTNLYTVMVDFMVRTIKTKLGYIGSPAPVGPDDVINKCYYGETPAQI